MSPAGAPTPSSGGIDTVADDAARGFGPSALATPANAITVIRILLTPLLLVMIVNSGRSYAALAFGVCLGVSDGLDGYLARKHGTTRSGAFLDPLADKLLVLGSLYALVAIDTFWVVPVVIITAREMAMSVYRAQLGRRGLAVHARQSAKVKTVFQELAIGFGIAPFAADLPIFELFFLWSSVGLALYSGAQYVLDGRKAVTAV